MGIYNICESASVDGECRFNCITVFERSFHNHDVAVITYAVVKINNFK